MIKTPRIFDAPHSRLPEPFRELLRTMWRTQIQDASHTFSMPAAKDRAPAFEMLLTSEPLALVLADAYKLPAGPTIAEALASEAVLLPERWSNEDQRAKADKAKQFRNLQRALDRLNKMISADRSVSAAKIAAKQRPALCSFESVVSEKLPARRWRRWTGLGEDGLPHSAKVQLTLYDLQSVIRAFAKPVSSAVEIIKQHGTLDPGDALADLGRTKSGNLRVRYYASRLDAAVDHLYSPGVRARRGLSRDRLVSTFVAALLPGWDPSTIDRGEIYRMRKDRQRRCRAGHSGCGIVIN